MIALHLRHKVAEKVLGRSMKVFLQRQLTITQFSSLVVGIHVPIGDYPKTGMEKKDEAFSFLPYQIPYCARCFAPACSHVRIERKMQKHSVKSCFMDRWSLISLRRFLGAL
jgi:hypothetical protein